MGAELICYIVKGPTYVRDDKVVMKRATAHATLVLGKVRALCKLNYGDPKHDKKVELLTKQLGKLTGNNLYFNDPSEFKHLSSLRAKSVVGDFVKLWNREGALPRDANCRHFLDFTIFVAGEPSWEDEPDGHGYATIKHAIQLGILKFFGVS